jgi:hypothetical protein
MKLCIGIHVQNLFDSLFVPQLLFPRFASLDAILRFEHSKKQVSHVTSLHYYIYEENEIISKPSLTTKENSNIIASKNLIASISSCKNKSKIKRSVLQEK